MSPRILLVEDNPNDAELIAREVRRALPEAEFRTVCLLADCAREVREFRPELVVSDHNLPGCTGRAVLQAVLAADRDIGFVLVTGSLDEETAVEYMKAGASDYLLKDRLVRLGPAVLGALERARRRRSLHRQQLLLQKVIDANPSLVYVKDWDGRFMLANQALAAVYGTTVEALIGRSVADLDPPAAEAERMLVEDRGVMTTRRPKTIPEELVTHPQTRIPRWFHTIKVPLVLDDENGPLLLGVGTDITDRRRLEEQLRLSQKMEAVGTLAGGIAHDFNNLLAAIRATVDLALLESQVSGPLAEDLKEVARLVDRAAALTRQILAFGRRQVLEPRILDVNTLVEGTTKMLDRIIGEDVRLVIERAVDPTTVSADPGQLEQVLMNLCVNARDAMPQGGELAILTHRVFIDEEFCLVHPWARQGDYVRVTVSDTGTGMDAATQTRIFEPFFTTKEMGRGTGLGLAVVYGIVKQHDGFIHVYSETGRGTSFRVYLPYRVAVVEQALPESTEDLVGGTETILLAEDDDAVRSSARRLLTRLGYRVIAVTNGLEAVAAFAEHGSALDLAMLDVVMPGMTGPDVFELVRASHPEIRFLFSTGYSPGTSHLTNLRTLPAHLITKPYGISELARAVRRALDQPAVRAE